MTPELREIADLVLRLIDEAENKPAPADGNVMQVIMNSEQMKPYIDKYVDAVRLLESDNKIKCFWTNDILPYAAGLTIKGKLRLEELNNQQKSIIKEKDYLRDDAALVISRHVYSFEQVKASVSNFSVIDQIILYEGFLRDLEEEDNYPMLIPTFGIKHQVREEIQYLEKIKSLEKEKELQKVMESQVSNMKNEIEFYNDFMFDIIKISRHYDSIKDPFLQKNYLDWLLKIAEERYIENMANKSEEEKNTIKYKDGMFTYNSLKKYIEEQYRRLETNIIVKEEETTRMVYQKNAVFTKAKNRIAWKGSIADLKELFRELKLAGMIEEITQPNAVIRDCFVKTDGTDFNDETVRKTNVRGKSKNYDKIKKSVDNVKKRK